MQGVQSERGERNMAIKCGVVRAGGLPVTSEGEGGFVEKMISKMTPVGERGVNQRFF